MEQENKIDEVLRLLKWHYYGNIILLIGIFLLILFRIIPLFPDEHFTVGVTAERYAIILSIIVIPVSLKFFAHRLKKISRPLGTMAAAKKYKNVSLFRLYSISAVTLMHILLFGISRNMNFFWFTIVLFIVFLFCRPSYEELKSLTELPDEQSPSEKKQAQPEEGKPESGEALRTVEETEEKVEEV